MASLRLANFGPDARQAKAGLVVDEHVIDMLLREVVIVALWDIRSQYVEGFHGVTPHESEG